MGEMSLKGTPKSQWMELPSREPPPSEEQWGPRIVPKSGPAFHQLTPQQQADLKRLHSNLGHPSAAKLAKVLIDRGTDSGVVAAARSRLSM